MKAVLISIQPKWVDKIAKGEKTIEVRKTRPKIETPFKCYIYMSQGTYKDLGLYSDWIYQNRMRVIGEFTCDRIDSYIDKHLDDNRYYWDLSVKEWEDLTEKSCLTIPQIIGYTGDSNTLYGWHISDLVIYDKPRELSEFKAVCSQKQCASWCKDMKIEHAICLNKGKRFLTRPPQSWQFVESLGE